MVTDAVRIALAQMAQHVGDLSGNADAILEVRAAAAAQGADLVMTPEMQVTGYPVEDLVLKAAFVRGTLEQNNRLVEATAEPGWPLATTFISVATATIARWSA